MNWETFVKRMNSRPTDGSEFNNGIIIPGNPKVGHTTCDYCGCEVLCIWDDHNKDMWWPYLGNQACRPMSYKYSPIIQTMRKFYGVEGITWDQDHGNLLMNSHARAHCQPEDWSKRAHSKGVKILCSKCFRLTYNRIKVLGDNGITYALSVVPSRGETIESVMEDLEIKGKIIGRGGISNY